MAFWWIMFFCNVLIPALLIMAGMMMWKHCPKEINGVVGYRTSRSMKNMDTWKFAHEYCGRLWWRIGWVTLIPTVLVQIPFYNGNDTAIGVLTAIICTIQTIILIVSIFPTENALKRTFLEDGTRR